VNSDTIKKIGIYLIVAFLIVSIWRNPIESAHAAGHFLAAVGDFFASLIERIATFITSLSSGDET
jgi:dolichol kinase